MNTKISFVIPYLNGMKSPAIVAKNLWLEINKTYESFEIIIIDDGSKSKSEITSEYHSVFYYYFNNNRGQSYATALGIIKSSGDIIVTLDDDLVYKIEPIKILIDKYKNSKIDLLYGIRMYNKQHTFFRNLVSNSIKSFLYFFTKNKPSSIRVLDAKFKNLISVKIDLPNFSLDKLLSNNSTTQSNIAIKFDSEGKSRYTLIKLFQQIFRFFVFK